MYFNAYFTDDHNLITSHHEYTTLLTDLMHLKHGNTQMAVVDRAELTRRMIAAVLKKQQTETATVCAQMMIVNRKLPQ